VFDGVGKSAFINAYLKARNIQNTSQYCKADVGAATGVITGSRHLFLIDTSDLADIKTRKEAAKKIAAKLRHGGPFKIVFMCVLSSGKYTIRREDVTIVNFITTTLVYQKAVKYTLLVNKISTKAIKKLRDIPGAFDDFIKVLHIEPELVCFSLFDIDLMNEDDVYLDIEDQKLLFHSPDNDCLQSTPMNFVDGLEKFPVMHVDPMKQLEIDISSLDEGNLKFEKESYKLKKESNKLKLEANKLKQEAKLFKEDAKKREDDLYKTIERLRSETTIRSKKREDDFHKTIERLRSETTIRSKKREDDFHKTIERLRSETTIRSKKSESYRQNECLIC
jgi:FtsZ-binding cell division protein ZapB